MTKKIYYVIEFENRDNYCIGDFQSYTKAEKYIKDNNLDEYPSVPIIVKKNDKISK